MCDQPEPSLGQPISAMPTGTTPLLANIRAPSPAELTVITAAETQRGQVLPSTLSSIDAVLAKGNSSAGAPSFSPSEQHVADAVATFLYVTTINNLFWDTLQKARDLIARNQSIAIVPYFVDTVKSDFAYVYPNDTSRGMYLTTKGFFPANSYCQREVLLHEYFHFVGCGHYYDTSTTTEALQCAHHMAEFVYEIATSCVGGCSRSASNICHARP
jgi:hypothetical protein